MKVRAVIDFAQQKIISVLCCQKGARTDKFGASAKFKYGSLASGGKYDESDDEEVKGMLYNNNLLMDDDDEEEQIVIITKEKSSQPEKRFQSTQPGSVDHSVFQEGKGLLDLSMSTKPAPSMPSSFDQMMRRIEVE